MLSTKSLLAVLVVLLMSTFSARDTRAENEDVRHFLFIGEPNSTAWKVLIENLSLLNIRSY